MSWCESAMDRCRGGPGRYDLDSDRSSYSDVISCNSDDDDRNEIVFGQVEDDDSCSCPNSDSELSFSFERGRNIDEPRWSDCRVANLTRPLKERLSDRHLDWELVAPEWRCERCRSTTPARGMCACVRRFAMRQRCPRRER